MRTKGSDCMAHLTSYQIGGAVGVLRHNERTETDTVHERKNEYIVPERTHFNYNLAPQRYAPLYEHIKQVCADNNIRLNNRKDLNVMSSWIVTKPKDVLEQEQENFFADTYAFLINRYGKENVLSACVHLDESTPHIHFEFIPVGTDKNGCKTVSSKLVCTRKDLQSFHKDLSSHLEQTFGRKISIENGATIEGNKAIEELKRGTATEALKIALISAEEVQGKVTTLKTACTQLEGNFEHLRSIETEINEQPTYAEKKKKAFKGEIIEIPADKYKAERYKALTDREKMNKLENSYKTLKSQYDRLCDSRYKFDRQYEEVKHKLSKAGTEIETLKSQLDKSIRKSERFEKRLEVTNRVLQAYPDAQLEVKKEIQSKEKGQFVYKELSESQIKNLRWLKIDFEVKQAEGKNIVCFDKADEQEIIDFIKPQNRGFAR